MSHLFFADDSLVFCKATMEEWDFLNNILGLYEFSSGQKLNRDKTSLFQQKHKAGHKGFFDECCLSQCLN